MKRKVQMLAVSVAGIVLLFALVGCQATDKDAEEPAGSDAEENVASATTDAGGDQPATGSDAAVLPADWPDDLPIYPGTTVITTVDYDTGGAQNIGVTLDSTDEPKTINDWYTTEVVKSGWEITGQAETDGNYVISGVKGEDQLTIAIATGLGTPNTSVNVNKIVIE